MESRSHLVTCTVVATLLLSSWLLGGRVLWFGYVAAAICVANLLLLFPVGFISTSRQGTVAFAGGAALFCYVLVSAFNPSYRFVEAEGGTVLTGIEHLGMLPSTAQPSRTVAHLASLFCGLTSACLIGCSALHRHDLRGLLAIAVINAVVLALLGLFYRLDGTGRVLGILDARGPTFFATFLYRNHWGAFALLNCFAALGLFQYQREHERKARWVRRSHQPSWFCLLAAGLLLLTILVVGSRSAMVGLIAGAAFWLVVQRKRSVGGRWCWAGAGSLLLLLAIYAFILQPEALINVRARSLQDYHALLDEDVFSMRLGAAQDAWKMVKDHPVFGVGLGSFRHIWPAYAGPEYLVLTSDGVRLPTMEFAHTDWLQYLAELGVVGFTLLLLPLALAFGYLRQGRMNPISEALLAGVAAILVIAWFEFPLSNPAVLIETCILAAVAIRYAVLEQQAWPTIAPAGEPVHLNPNRKETVSATAPIFTTEGEAR